MYAPSNNAVVAAAAHVQNAQPGFFCGSLMPAIIPARTRGREWRPALRLPNNLSTRDLLDKEWPQMGVGILPVAEPGVSRRVNADGVRTPGHGRLRYALHDAHSTRIAPTTVQ